MDKPKVLHLIRKWLHPMDVFIMHQVLFAERYEPVVLCHRRLKYSSPADHCVNTIVDYLTPFGRTVDRVAYGSARYLPGLTVRAAQEFIRKAEPRVIHVHYLVDDAFYAPLLRDISVPVVVSGYGYDVSRFPAQAFGLGKLYLKRGLDPPNVFLALSEHMKQDFVSLGVPADDIKVHYHGIDVGRFAYPAREYASDNTVRILTCARLVPKKGHEVLLRALRAMLDRNGLSRKIELSIVGGGPLRGELEKLSAQLDLRDIVRFKGHIPYVSEGYVAQYKQADMFVLPCRRVGGTKEGIPGTLIEAMASGLPIISTVHAGIPEVVRHNVDGVLVAESSVEELADAMSALIAHADLRRNLGIAAAHRAWEFDVKKQTRELEKIYSALTGEEEKPKRKGDAHTPT